MRVGEEALCEGKFVQPFWGSDGPPQSGMVDMLIPDRFEIGFSKEMVCGVIFGVKYQILPE